MARSKRAQKIRTADEFQLSRMLRSMQSPPIPTAAYSWELSTIMAARDAQIAGRFSQPVRLAVAMRTDDALFVAHKNRIAPQRAISVRLEAAKGGRAGRVLDEAEALFGNEGSAVSRETLADINSDLANHGIAIGHNEWVARDDGSRIDVVHHHWPLEFVSWDSVRRVLYTQVDQATPGTGTRGSSYVDIVHGDGTWVVYSAHETMPWQKDAAILSGGIVWAAHAFANRDWCRGSASHGNAKVIGELPEGCDMQIADPTTGLVGSNPQAVEFLELLKDIASLDTPVGIKPFGSKIDYLTNGSRAWEVWKELKLDRKKAAAQIYLGTDGTLGAAGGAPGVDIATLFGVATTILQADLGAMRRGVRTGVMEPWGAVNFGDSALVPDRCYEMADPDAARERADTSANEAAYCKAITDRRAAGLVVTQEWCDTMADRYGVEPLELADAQIEAPAQAETQQLRGTVRLAATEPTLAIVAGLPASGKTTFATRELSAMLRVNRDDSGNRASQLASFATAIKDRHNIVVDDTNTTTDIRSQFIGPAQRVGYRIVGYQMGTQIDVCLRRNDARDAKVPAVAIYAAAKALQPLAFDEGFSAIADVTATDDGYEITKRQAPAALRAV